MTDEFAPVEPSGSQGPAPAVTPAARPKGGRGAIVIIVVIVVFLAVVLYAVRNNVQADELKVGDCFDVPNGTTVKTVERHACTESHTAEVFHVAEFTGDASTYPISMRLDSFVGDACDPVFATYVGTTGDAATELSIGYFYPSRDGWSAGDRTITCYAARSDEGPMTKSVRGSASQ